MPDVIEEFSSETVMVQERIFGQRLMDLPAVGKRADLAHSLIHAYMQQFFVLGFFHGDPHPGNRLRCWPSFTKLAPRSCSRSAKRLAGVGLLTRDRRHAMIHTMYAATRKKISNARPIVLPCRGAWRGVPAVLAFAAASPLKLAPIARLRSAYDSEARGAIPFPGVAAWRLQHASSVIRKG